MGSKTDAKESYRNVIHFDERTCTKDALTTLYQALRQSSTNFQQFKIMAFFSDILAALKIASIAFQWASKSLKNLLSDAKM